ncbi:MAG: hypothetical protein KGV59_03585 [Tenacibaculum sp.]|nr:hypothetical protein [Tenacibaculum sp.]
MRKHIDYLLHHTLWKNEKVAFFSFVISPIATLFMFLDMKLYIPLKIVLCAFCLTVFAIMIYKRKNFYNNFYRTKYINSSKGSYLMYSIEEKKKFYDTIIQVIKNEDLKEFKDIMNLQEFEYFTDKITENLNTDFFTNKIKQASSNVWIRDYFNFINITKDSLSYIKPLIDNVQVFNYKELATLIYTNIVFSEKGVILNDNFNKDLHQLISEKEIKKLFLKILMKNLKTSTPML